jgi:DNA-binding XRE family transcriptional regulator
VRQSVSAIHLDASFMATHVRVETIPGITSTSGVVKPPALNGASKALSLDGIGATASNGTGPHAHCQDAGLTASDPRPVVRCDRCRLVQFRASHNRCRRCLMPFVVAAPPPPEPVVEAEAHPDIASGVRAWRQQRGLTQKQLAFAAHLPRTYISRIENGRILPGLSTLERVAGALHVGLSALLDRRGKNGHNCSAGNGHNGYGTGVPGENGHGGLNGNGNGIGHGSGNGFVANPMVYDTASNGAGNGLSDQSPSQLPNQENEAFLRQMVRYCRRMTVVQRATVLDRVRQLAATAH